MKFSSLALTFMSMMAFADAQGLRSHDENMADGRHRVLKMKKSKKSKKSKESKSGKSSKPMQKKKTLFTKPPKKETFEVKLTAGNEIEPFKGIEYAFGTATVTISNNRACIKAMVDGFIAQAAHIHEAPIDMNGDIVVDFTPLLTKDSPDFGGCIRIDTMLAAEITENPDLYYVNVHAGTTAETILLAIRGQLVSGFTVPLEIEQLVFPFNANDIPDASGIASVQFEKAGTVACWDVTIRNFDPALGHVHMAMAGSNGPRIFNYSGLKVDAGRFLGCQDLTAVDENGDPMFEGDVEAVKALLSDPTMYFFDYHLALDTISPTTGENVGAANCVENCDAPIHTSIRGQIY